MKMRDLLQEVSDEELFKFQRNDFLSKIEKTKGILNSDFQRYLLPEMELGDIYFSISFKSDPHSKIDRLHGLDREILLFFKSLADLKEFSKSLGKNIEINHIMELRGFSKDDISFPIPFGFDKIIVYCVFKKRFDTFSINSRQSLEKFIKANSTGKLQIKSIVAYKQMLT